MIDLRSSESVLGFSGKIGYSIGPKHDVIAKIFVHTSQRTPGPYGNATNVSNVVDFQSPIGANRPLVGNFGRRNSFLESLRVKLRVNN